MKRIFLLAMAMFASSFCFAQVEVIADGRLQTLLEQHVTFNELSRVVPGYRIKLGGFTGAGSKKQAFDIKNDFTKRFPQVRIYVFFDEPNFTVMCGDYTSRLDAYGLYVQLKPIYSRAAIVKDWVNFPVLSQDDLSLPEYYEDEGE